MKYSLFFGVEYVIRKLDLEWIVCVADILGFRLIFMFGVFILFIRLLFLFFCESFSLGFFDE